MSLPSIRECEQKLATLADQPATDDNLARAITVARALLHYVRNAGTPPVQPPTPKQQAMSLGPISKREPERRSVPAHLVRPADPHATRYLGAVTMTAAQIRAADGLVNQSEAARLLKISNAQLQRMVREGTFPKPRARRGAALIWKRSDVEACLEQRNQPMPAGHLTVQQFIERIGVSESHFWALHKSGKLPPSEGRHHRQQLWSEATVAAYVRQREEERNAPPVAYVPPEGHLVTKQLLQLIDRTDSWLFEAMRDSGFPRPAKRDGNRCLWRRDEVQSWVDQQAAVGKTQGAKHFGAMDPRTTTTPQSKGKA